jgi:hypothetical protein
MYQSMQRTLFCEKGDNVPSLTIHFSMRKYNITLGRQSYAKCCLRNIIWCRGHNSCFGQHFANVGYFVLNSTIPA